MLSRWDLSYRGLLCPERSIRVNEFSMYYYLRVEKIEDEIFFLPACLTLLHKYVIKNCVEFDSDFFPHWSNLEF